MEGTRSRQPAQAGGIFLRGEALAKLLNRDGKTTVRDRAAHLGVKSLGVVSDAFKGKPVNLAFIYRVRLRYPRVPYERLFREVTDVPAHDQAA